MVAPRAILIQYRLNDEVTNTWSHEQAYYSARRVFSLLRQPNRIGLLRVPGFHGSDDVRPRSTGLSIRSLHGGVGRRTEYWRPASQRAVAQLRRANRSESLSGPHRNRPAVERRGEDRERRRLGKSGCPAFEPPSTGCSARIRVSASPAGGRGGRGAAPAGPPAAGRGAAPAQTTGTTTLPMCRLGSSSAAVTPCAGSSQDAVWRPCVR